MALALIRQTHDLISIVGRHSVFCRMAALPYPAYAWPDVHCESPFGFSGWRLCLIRPTRDPMSTVGRHSVFCRMAALPYPAYIRAGVFL